MKFRLELVDWAVALGLVVLGETQLGLYRACCEPQRVTGTGFLLTLAATLPLALRRRFPVPVLLSIGAAEAAQVVLQSPVTDFSRVGVLIAFYTVAAQSGRVPATVIAALTPVGLAAARLVDGATQPQEWLDLLVEFAAAWGLGELTRYRGRQAAQRAAHAERANELVAREAAARERDRIARELHDVVSHSLSVITIQAGAARSVMATAPDRLSASLLSIEAVSREAWAEMRQFLDPAGMDGDADAASPRPGLAHVEELVERFEAAGLTVSLVVSGEAVSLPADADLCAYRVVQESLTNALRHAGRRGARVSIEHGHRIVEVTVASESGRPPADGLPATAGHHGLAGMRERVRLAGGDLSVEDGPGGFVVRARLAMAAR